LTGESFSVEKDGNAVIKDQNAVLQDQLNMVFSGTSVTVGKALVMVVFTGERTEIGKIHESISEVETEKTPLKIALDDFGFYNN
jgi:P-type Ca2+ transporter type 2A